MQRSQWMEEDSFGGGGPNLFSLKKPRDVRAGCASGLKSLGKGVLTGCVAIIAVPVYGAVTESNALEQQLQQEDATQKTGEAKNRTNNNSSSSSAAAKKKSWRERLTPGGSCLGFVKGIFMGAIGAVCLPVAGACVCCVQVTRGCMNTPQAIKSAAEGKQWDDETRKWVPKPGTALVVGDVDSHERVHERTCLNVTQQTYLSTAAGDFGEGEEGEADYYKVLGVRKEATEQEIKRAYYHLARVYHPDKNKDNPNAHERFQMLGEAYQVLSDPELREKYDKHGKDALDVNFMDYACVFTILFGSEKFEPLIGQLMLATATESGGELDGNQMQQIQKDRVAKLVVSMTEMLSEWVNGEREQFMKRMHSFGEELSKCSFGDQVLAVISNIYAIQAERSLGGFGAFGAAMKMQRQKMKSKMNVAGAAMRVMQAHFEIKKLNDEERKAESSSSSTGASGSSSGGADEKKSGNRKAKIEEMALPLMLEAMWAANVVDIETTVAKVCSKVLNDKQASKDTKRERALALKSLSETFQSYSNVKSNASGLSKTQDARQKLQDALYQFQQKKLNEEESGG